MKKLRNLKNRKIDKVDFCDGKSPTILDNTAYQLYSNSIIEYNKKCEKYGCKLTMRQWYFKESDESEKFYNDAKILIRNEKLNKIENGIKS